MKRTIIAAALAAGTIAVSGCWGAQAAAKMDAPVDAGPRVVGASLTLPDTSQQIIALAITPVASPGASTIQLNGRLVWDEDRTVRVFSPFAGQVVGVRAGVGEAVHSGEVLATMGRRE